MRSTSVELVVGVAARQLGRSTVELRREMVPGQGFKPRFAASEAAVLSLDDPGMLVPLLGFELRPLRFEGEYSFH